MATTTNFGWETPDDTDLVKDGAAAIRTALGGVDTSFVDLKGGTTGQVLSKASNTDLDFSWVAQDDSNAIQNALLTTTGDTIYASGASTPVRLGIGSTGQVLTVAGGVPTWATPASGSTFSGCKLYKSADQSCGNNADTDITFDLEIFDTDGFHSTSTNTARITVPTGKAGKYALVGQVNFTSNGSGQRWVTIEQIGTGVVGRTNLTAMSGDSMWVQASAIATASVGDYFVLRVYQTSGVSLNALGGDISETTFSATYLGA